MLHYLKLSFEWYIVASCGGRSESLGSDPRASAFRAGEAFRDGEEIGDVEVFREVRSIYFTEAEKRSIISIRKVGRRPSYERYGFGLVQGPIYRLR
jgi:hypothetical protein